MRIAWLWRRSVGAYIEKELSYDQEKPVQAEEYL